MVPEEKHEDNRVPTRNDTRNGLSEYTAVCSKDRFVVCLVGTILYFPDFTYKQKENTPIKKNNKLTIRIDIKHAKRFHELFEFFLRQDLAIRSLHNRLMLATVLVVIFFRTCQSASSPVLLGLELKLWLSVAAALYGI
jgi:hypothetical protein